MVMEGLSSLLVAQRLGQVGTQFAGEGESYQFTFLVIASIVYVGSAWWMVAVRLFPSEYLFLFEFG